jgi:hypothetical protein
MAAGSVVWCACGTCWDGDGEGGGAISERGSRVSDACVSSVVGFEVIDCSAGRLQGGPGAGRLIDCRLGVCCCEWLGQKKGKEGLLAG